MQDRGCLICFTHHQHVKNTKNLLMRWERAQSFSPVQLFAPIDCNPTRLLCPWDSPGKNARGGCCLPPGDCPNLGDGKDRNPSELFPVPLI